MQLSMAGKGNDAPGGGVAGDLQGRDLAFQVACALVHRQRRLDDVQGALHAPGTQPQRRQRDEFARHRAVVTARREHAQGFRVERLRPVEFTARQ